MVKAGHISASRQNKSKSSMKVPPSCYWVLYLHRQFATIELRRREIDKHRQAQKKREHSQEEAEKDAIRKSVEGEKAWAETER